MKVVNYLLTFTSPNMAFKSCDPLLRPMWYRTSSFMPSIWGFLYLSFLSSFVILSSILANRQVNKNCQHHHLSGPTYNSNGFSRVHYLVSITHVSHLTNVTLFQKKCGHYVIITLKKKRTVSLFIVLISILSIIKSISGRIFCCCCCNFFLNATFVSFSRKN